MTKPLMQTVEELQEQVCALQQLLLAHVVAFDQVDRLATDATFEIARGQADAAHRNRRPILAIRIGAMVEAAQDCRG